MRLEYQIIIAMALDLILGDPRRLPHPVRFIGRLALWLENFLCSYINSKRLAGVFTAILVILISGGLTFAIIHFLGFINPNLSYLYRKASILTGLGNTETSHIMLGIHGCRIKSIANSIMSIFLLYTTLAAKDLYTHGMKVYQALNSKDIAGARLSLSMMVGRDTENLNEREIIRAAVESIAESIVDGIIAPLFYAVIGGPMLAIIYKAINTLDSSFGYKNERYIEFGWASARIDDAANFIPARITAFFIPVAAFFLRARARHAFRIMLRDGKKHPSPNAGLPEAAVAGALGVELGGLNYYSGRPSEKPILGDPMVALNANHIIQTNRIMLTAFLLTGMIFLSIRWVILL